MGQQIEKTLESGFTVSWWVVQTAIFDISKNTITISFAGYKDEEHYLGGGDKALEQSVEFSADENPELKAAVLVYLESRMAQALET